MIDESFIQKILDISMPEVMEINGLDYSSKQLHAIDDPKPEQVLMTTLTGVVDYVKNILAADDKCYVHISDFAHVKLNAIERTSRGGNKTFAVSAPAADMFEFGTWHGIENFIIALQGQFVQDETTAKILSVIGNVKDGVVRNFSDDGVTQSVTAKIGVAMVQDVSIPNPVTLRPYRTFIEVEQPVSQFVFRMKSGDKSPMCALFESDGGKWKNEAMENIKKWIKERLPEALVVA